MKEQILSGDNKGQSVDVKPMHLDKVKELRTGTRALVHTGYFGRNRLSGVIHVKINGKPKTWKTRPDDVSVPIKYGLYEYATVDYRDGVMADENLYIVEQEN